MPRQQRGDSRNSGWNGRWIVALLLLIGGLSPGLPLQGEPLPNAPVASSNLASSSIWAVMRPPRAIRLEQPRPRALDYALYGSIVTYRTLDYLSTRRALAGGAHEVVLPQWVVQNRGAFIAFEGLASAGEVGSSVWLIHHGHRRLARAANFLSIGLGANSVYHNYTEPLGAPAPE